MDKLLIGWQHGVDQAAVNRLGALITDMRPGDEVTITLEKAEDEEMWPILQVLGENGFRVKEQGEKAGKSFIQAQRMYH
ncbi:MAG: hypothetical protein ACM3NT_10555 [Methylocystaceae bacterium]